MRRRGLTSARVDVVNGQSCEAGDAVVVHLQPMVAGALQEGRRRQLGRLHLCSTARQHALREAEVLVEGDLAFHVIGMNPLAVRLASLARISQPG